MLKAF
jgi:hypothetical protein